MVQGYSAGSQVALLYASAYPDSLAGLISVAGFAKSSSLITNPRSLCSPMHLKLQSDHFIAEWERATTFSRSALTTRPLLSPVNSEAWGLFSGDTPLAIMPGDQLPDRLQAAFEEVIVFDVEDRVKEIQVPTLVVGGRHDPIVPIEESIAIHEGILNSSLLVLENSEHGAKGSDVPIFKEIVLRFLSQLAA